MKRKQSLVWLLSGMLLVSGCGAAEPAGTGSETSSVKAEQAAESGEGEAAETAASTEAAAEAAADSGDAAEREHRVENPDRLLGCITYYNSENDPLYDIYYAYNSYGEVMFSVKESFDKVPLVSELYFYNTAGKTHVISQELAEGSALISVSEMDLTGKTLESLHYLREAGVLQVNGGSKYTYAADGLSATSENWDGSTGEQKFDEKGNMISETIVSAESGSSYSSESTYDEYGNRLTYRMYLDGNLNTDTRYEYELNEYGQPTFLQQMDSEGNVTGTALYEYGDLSEVPEETRNDPLVGYWSGELDGTEYFLCISMNGMLCYGRLEGEFKAPVAVWYAYYTVEEGYLDCEIYENFTDSSASEELPYERNGDQLDFYEISWTRADG